MSIFNSGFFWFIEGILTCLVILGIKTWAKDRGIRLTWWKWFLILLWFSLAGFTLAFVGTSLGENEPIAALRGGVLFGVLTIILGVAFWRLLSFEKKKN